MTIVRVTHSKDNPYVILNKISLWDPDLSLEAVGLWARLMSRPDDWIVRVSELAKSCGRNEGTIKKYLNELVKNGYAFRRRSFDPITGKIAGYETHVFEVKKSKEEIEAMYPSVEKPPVEKPPVEKPPLLSNKINILSKEKSERTCAREEEPLFLQNAVKFPKKHFEALKAKYGLATLQKTIEDLNLYSRSKPSKFKEYKDHAAVIETWIKRDLEKTQPRQNGKIQLDASGRDANPQYNDKF